MNTFDSGHQSHTLPCIQVVQTLQCLTSWERPAAVNMRRTNKDSKKLHKVKYLTEKSSLFLLTTNQDRKLNKLRLAFERTQRPRGIRDN